MRYSTWNMLPKSRADSLPLSILAARGITAKEDIECFFDSPLSCLHDPFLLPDMHKAVERIKKALASNEKIAVYGDYDVDGVTATCLLVEYLRSQNADCVYFIPNREEDGYGLHDYVIRTMRGDGVSLIVTVDVGVMAFEAANAAKEAGIDLIITDHHSCKGPLPDAVAVVCPCREDSEYPYARLAGVGVAFKLVCALETGDDIEQLLLKYGDLVALGTVADIMPLNDENRILVSRGLSVLSSAPRLGISFLLNALGLGGKPVTSSTISYSLAPVLNAAGRMKSPDLALELLLTKDSARAQTLTAVLDEANAQRRKLEADIYAQAMKECEGIASNALVLSHKDWHQGVTGIVAAKLLDKYEKPVFIISVNGNTGKGTARCPHGINLMEILEKCSELLLGFGGHSFAAGFTIETDKIKDFEYAVQKAVQPSGKREDALVIDAVVVPSDITIWNAEGIAAMAPFGAANPEPVLMMNGVTIKRITPLKDGKHLRLLVGAGGMTYTVICFGFAYNEFPYCAGDAADIAFCLSLNHFRGDITLQLELKDIR